MSIPRTNNSVCITNGNIKTEPIALREVYSRIV